MCKYYDFFIIFQPITSNVNLVLNVYHPILIWIDSQLLRSALMHVAKMQVLGAGFLFMGTDRRKENVIGSMLLMDSVVRNQRFVLKGGRLMITTSTN